MSRLYLCILLRCIFLRPTNPGVYGLLGANGAGKTTLMRMLCALLESTSGEVLLDGKEVASMGADYRNVLGYLPQDFGYYPNDSAKEFLMYVAALKGIPKDIAKNRTEELLDVIGLSNVANKKIKTFSGGMKQRVGIAQALLNNPQILILDEPTAGLDPKERVRFRNLLSEYAGDTKSRLCNPKSSENWKFLIMTHLSV